MATRAPQAITLDGVALTFHAAASGDKVSGAGAHVAIIVTNASGSSVNLTVDPPGQTDYGVATPSKVIAVAAGATKAIPMLSLYRDPADSYLVSLTWSATTDVTFAVVRL